MSILKEAIEGRATIVPTTVEQYRAGIEGGFIPEDLGTELIDGFIVRKDRGSSGGDLMTVGNRHRISVQNLQRLTADVERLGAYLSIQQPIALPPNNEPEPDGAIILGSASHYRDGSPTAEYILSVIEVADRSLRRDLGVKKQIYIDAAIPQYVVVDLVNNRVIVHERPSEKDYESIQIYTGDDLFAFHLRDAKLEVSAGSLLI